MEQKPFVLRYREGQVVHEGQVLARDFDTAERVGLAWCNQAGNRRFIHIHDPVLADEGILSTVETEADYGAMTAVERLAKMQGKTTEQVLDDLKTKRKVSPLAQQERFPAATKPA
jgi:spore coat polysaccharide biosynthesis protein SpsF (cytidylyltransferase family)